MSSLRYRLYFAISKDIIWIYGGVDAQKITDALEVAKLRLDGEAGEDRLEVRPEEVDVMMYLQLHVVMPPVDGVA